MMSGEILGIEKGGKFAVGVDHKQVEAWFRKAKPSQEMRVDIGLYLRRSETTAHWFYRYKSPINGKQTRAPLWTAADPCGALGFPKATIAEARSRAAILRGQVAVGIDPVLRAATEAQEREEAERKATKEREARLTVRQLFDRWCSTELKASVTPSGERSGRKDNGAYLQAQFERHVFPLIGDLMAQELRKADLLKVIDLQKAEGKLRTADVLFSSLRQMLNFALDRELIEFNPLATVRKKIVVGKQTERSRFLAEEEIQLLGTALTTARFNERSQAALWLILATGVRIGECMGAVWSEAIPTDPRQRQMMLIDLQTRGTKDSDGLKVGIIDLEARTWYLPATKNNRDHTIHLSSFALEQLNRLHATACVTSSTPWVFPSPRDHTRPVCVKSFGKQLADRQRDGQKKIVGRSKQTESLMLPGGRWTAHDLRRTTGTLMASLGISGDVIDEALNHKIESKVRRVYIRDRRQVDQAKAFEAVGEYLSTLKKSRKS